MNYPSYRSYSGIQRRKIRSFDELVGVLHRFKKNIKKNLSGENPDGFSETFMKESLTMDIRIYESFLKELLMRFGRKGRMSKRFMKFRKNIRQGQRRKSVEVS